MEHRGVWSRKLEFMLAAIGYSVGLGNVWRFPYLCYRSGGGAFLIPFFIMLLICGIPLALMEMASGQFTRQGPIGAIGQMCPFFKGAGVATVVLSFFFTTYYIVIITWAFYYMFSCFTDELPWTHCNHEWNSPLCWDNSTALNGTSLLMLNGSAASHTNYNNYTMEQNVTSLFQKPANARSPTEDFYFEKMLQKSSGIDEQGSMRWELLAILFMSWVIVYFCIWKGPKSTGKVVYFTATFPYLVLLILLVRGVTLDGAMDGISYFIYPRWEMMLDAKVWVNAAAQTFNSISVGFGGLITMSSYSKFNNNIVRDTLILAVADALTCLLAGFAIFSILGNLALNQGTAVTEVVQEGPGLVFVIYPQAFTTMPVPQLFAFLFFFMLVCLGIDSQFASVEVIVTTIMDHFDHHVRKYLRRKEVLVAVVCFISFLFGLPNVMQGGYYFFLLIDYYAAALSLMILTIFETIAICWFYGAKNLANNIETMTGRQPSIFFIVCWYFASPSLLIGVWVFSLIQYQDLSVAGYVYPEWAIGLGWTIALMSVLCIPAGMVHAVYSAKGFSFMQKLKTSFKTTLDPEGPQPDGLDDGLDSGLDSQAVLTKVITTSFVDTPDCNPPPKDCIKV